MSTPLSLTAASLTRPARRVKRERHGGTFPVEADVRSLLEAVGTVEEDGGRLRVTLGGETETFDPPHAKDVDVQMLVDLRRMLRSAGITS
jgi:hypothetical protein